MHLHFTSHLHKFLIFIIILYTIKLGVCNTSSHLEEFYSKSTLQDGVHELALYFDGIRAKESVAGPKEGSSRGIVARQLSNGRQIVNLIYNGVPDYLQDEKRHLEEDEEDSLLGMDEEGLRIRECKVEKSPEEVDKFIEEFHNSVLKLRLQTSIYDSSVENKSTYVSLNDVAYSEIPHHILALTKFKDLKQKCFKLNRKVRKLAKAHEKQRLRMQSQQNETSLNRQRRGVTNLLSVPNTKWCGQGYSAKSYDELGGLYGADSCCRQHDLHCPFFIQSFERKYGYFHFGLGTISHCSCDRRFKTCLKQIGTGAADVVGNVFFTLVKASCFDFQQKKVCKKRGFWSCLRWGYEKQAVIRNPIPWNM